MNRGCKKALMGLAALLILFFHFYVPITKSILEMTLVKASYIGVDIFFFISAVALTGGKKIDYKAFIKNRIINVYVIFVVLAIVATVYKKWKLTRLLFVITGLEFLNKGGGAFLWYIPAIMIIYLLGPLFAMIKERLGHGFLPLMLFIWLAVVIVLDKGFGYTSIFILLNRLPIYYFGLMYNELKSYFSNKRAGVLIAIGLVIGAALVYRFGGIRKLNVPVHDMYYVIVIPLTLSIVGFFELLYEKYNIHFRILQFIGGLTLEVYCLQMIFGFDIEKGLLRIIGNGQIAFMLTVAILILLSYVFYWAKVYIIDHIQKCINKSK